MTTKNEKFMFRYFKTFLLGIAFSLLSFVSETAAQKTNYNQTEIDSILSKMLDYVELHPDSVQNLGQILLQRSRELNYADGIIHSLNNIGLGFYWEQQYDSAMRYYSQAVQLSKSNPKSFLYALALSNYADIVDKRGAKDSAYIYHGISLNIFKELGDTRNIAMQHSSMGLIQWRRGKNIEALTHFFEALEHRRKLSDPKAIGMTLNNIGVAYWRLGNYEKALEAYSESLELRESIGNIKGIVVVSNNIGLIYLKLNNFEKAFEKFSFSLKLSKDHNYHFGVGYSSYNLADWHIKKGKYQKAELFAKSAIENYYRYLELNSVAMAMNYLGQAYQGQKRFDAAEKTFRAALDTAMKVNDNHSKTVTMQNIARLLIEKNKPAEAIEYLKKSEKYSVAEKVGDLLLDNHQIMSKAYASLGNYQSALAFEKKYIQMKDSLVYTELGNRLLSWQIKYETRLQEKENIQLKYDKQLRERELENLKSRQQFLVLILIVIALVLIGSIAFILYRRRVSGKILLQKNKLEEANQLLAEANETKKKLLSIIAHDLTSPFQGLFGHIEIAKEDMLQMTPDELKKQIDNISEAAHNLFSVAVGLLQWSQTQDQRIHIHKEVIDVKEIVASVLSILSMQAEKKEINLNVDIPDQMQLVSDKQLLTTILMNLCTNAIKFTPRKGMVSIKSFIHNTDMLISVSDNGVGIDPAKIDELFLLSRKKTSVGTENEKGTGFGLYISNEFANLIGGKILVESSPTSGSSFTVVIPQ